VSSRLDPNDLPGELRKAVKEALRLGWTAKRGGAGGWKLRSPGGTQWMHVAPASNIPDTVARDLRTKIGKAAMAEADEDLLAALDDPKETSVTIVCTVCEQEFLATDGFIAHQTACSQAAYAAQQAEQEASKAITPPMVDEPSEGRTEPLPGYVNSARLPAPSHRPDFPETPDSSKISNKEEDMVESRKKRPYQWNVVQPGLARALYEAMKSRSQHKGEATSTYANVIAAMIQETGIDNSTPPVLDDAQQKIDEILGVLGVDANLIADAQNMQAENEKLRSDLTTLKDLLGKY
jgi:hypothetical protein